ncbi:MAG TPA: zinc-ribbon domain containing protein [Chloroflexota bacterium]|nr:zinc-ribbon domain containing protein [Chloroflexota bacterium]
MSKRESADQQLRCAACGDGFVFTAGEQELYRLRGITAQPDHCPNCARGGAVLSNPRRGQQLSS